MAAEQTAVEFLFEQFFKVKWVDMPNKPTMFEQALQMEKEQHGKTWDKSWEAGYGDTFEQYYNETFKSE